eukprot:507298-Pyramimonas_sp.AAC.1
MTCGRCMRRPMSRRRWPHTRRCGPLCVMRRIVVGSTKAARAAGRTRAEVILRRQWRASAPAR